MQLYNTFNRRKEELVPINANEVKIYSCGPTVYDYSHIGNFRTFLFSDLLKRTLLHFGYDVTHVMNLTDVDDKTIRGSIELGTSLRKYTDEYKRAFFQDLQKLRIIKADTYCSATDHIPEMVELIKTLIDRGYAYKSADNSVYFNIRKFSGYGKLSKFDLEGMVAGARVEHDEYAKEQAQDFALWKAYTKEDGDVYWETELGKGRPGWHIECSAMSMQYLGEHFDIHVGGIDNMFPHHENEIAQSESATGKPFVNYWLHVKHLLADNKKMSKSAGSFYTLRDLIGKGFKENAVRFLLMANAHYRSKINFTMDSMHSASMAVEKLNRFSHSLDDYIEKDMGIQPDELLFYQMMCAARNFDKHLADDLNLPRAVGHVFKAIKYANISMSENGGLSKSDASMMKVLINRADRVLDVLDYNDAKTEDEAKVPDFSKLLEERELSRKDKRWLHSDEIRNMIIRKGYYIEDTLEGPRIRAIRNPHEKSCVILDVLEGYA